MASEHIKDVGSWFLGSLECNKRDFMIVESNTKKTKKWQMSNLIVKIN